MHTIKRDIIICSMLLTGLTTLADNAADHIRGITPQGRRLVLMEEFTNQGCGPCAAFAPKFEHTVWSRLGDVVALTYHGNYPDGADKIYLANTSDVISRMNYYDITSVPTLLFNGQRVSTDADLDTCINICARDAATLDLQSTATLHDGVLGVAASVKPMTNLSGRSLRLYVAAVEEYVKYAQSTSNGENHWLYVMRKMLPDGDGQSLPVTLLPDSTYSYHYQWTVSGYEDDRQLGIVVFVQDANTHDVLATQYVPRPSGTVSNAKILRVLDTPARICSPRFTAVIPFRNTGADTLRSANITVNINGSIQTTAWQGALPPLCIDTVRTQPFTDFSLAQDGNNQVSISLTEPQRHRGSLIARERRARQCNQCAVGRQTEHRDRQQAGGDHLDTLQLNGRRGGAWRTLYRQASPLSACVCSRCGRLLQARAARHRPQRHQRVGRQRLLLAPSDRPERLRQTVVSTDILHRLGRGVLQPEQCRRLAGHRPPVGHRIVSSHLHYTQRHQRRQQTAARRTLPRD